MRTTNYIDTFIAVSPDCPVQSGRLPAKAGSVAAIELELLSARPYQLTSDDLLFEVHLRRSGIRPDDDRQAREAFFARPKACLRASPLVKLHGWGLHHDARGHVAAHGMETETYRKLMADSALEIVPGMRSRRA
jgi:hypothetical protein